MRTIADMINEMTQELSNLPRFTAYAKVLQEKGVMGEIQLVTKQKIQTIKMPDKKAKTLVLFTLKDLSIDSGEASSIPYDRVTQAMARGNKMCKKRPDIIQEINERQRNWRGKQEPHKKPAPRRGEDRGDEVKRGGPPPRSSRLPPVKP